MRDRRAGRGRARRRRDLPSASATRRDDGQQGRTDAAHREAGLPLLLAGVSFGGYVAATAAQRLDDNAKPQRLLLVAPSTQKQQVPAVPPDTVVVHGEADEVVPLAATFDWARPQSLPVIVLPGVGHFFHGQLGLLKNVLVQRLQQRPAG